MQMSRKRNIKKEMFQPTTECIDSLAIDDIAGQAVPESGTSRTECSVTDSCTPHSRSLGTSSDWSPVDVSALIGADAC